MKTNIIYNSDCLTGLGNLPDDSIDCCVTSPPYYGLRDYGVDGQIGLEETPDAYITRLIEVFREIRRVLKPTGTLWVNIGDSYAGSGKGAWKNKTAQKEVYTPDPGDAVSRMAKVWKGVKPKDLIGIPWMLAFALRADGWFLRQDIIWSKPNPMPESVTDRCTKSHEYIFLLSRSSRYYFDIEAIKEKAVTNDTCKRNRNLTKMNNTPGRKEMGGLVRNDYLKRNKRSVWTVTTKPFNGEHFAVYPEKLIEDCIKAGCPENGIVLDPFMGSGTTGIVARKLNRKYIGFELNPGYIEIADKRLKKELGLFI